MTRYLDAKGLEDVDRRLEVAGAAFEGRRHLTSVPSDDKPRKPKIRIPTEHEMYANSKGVTEWLGKGSKAT